MTTIADMTLGELKQIVEGMIDERLSQLLGTFEILEEPDEENGLTWDDIRTSVERNRWTPPPGSKSSLDLLREDRDR